MRGGLVALACAFTIACGSSDDLRDASQDAAVDDVTDASVTSLDLPASQGTWSVSEDVSFNGTGAGDLGAIAITHGVGTIVFKGETAPAFFFASTSTPTGSTNDGGAFANERDFEIVAAAPDRFILVWITCATVGADDDLAYVFYESTDGFDSATELSATGTCTDVVANVDEAVALPEVNIAPPEVVPGFTIDGGSLAFDGVNAGSAQLQNETWSLYPFNEIDCSACATPGWFELHTLFWKPDVRDACLGILYLEAAKPSSVVLAYSICLPSFTTPYAGTDLGYDATWTTP